MTERLPLPGDFFVCEIAGSTVAGRTAAWVELGERIIDGVASPWSHAGVVLDGGRTMEAMPGGAKVGWLDQIRGPIAFSSWPLDDRTRRDLVRRARTFEGVPYSVLDYAAIGLHTLHIPIPHLETYIGDTGHMICSQLVDATYTAEDLHAFDDGLWFGYVKPSDLGRVLEGPSKRPGAVK